MPIRGFNGSDSTNYPFTPRPSVLWSANNYGIALLANPVVGGGVASLSAFYLVIKFKGGSGVRTEGRTLVHKPGDDDPSL